MQKTLLYSSCHVIKYFENGLILKYGLNLLQISHGPTYVISLEGLGVTPGLGFSFPAYNFGNCFIIKPGIPPKTKVLTLINKDKKEIR